MNPVLALLAALAASAVFAGAETGYYATPALRLRIAARGSRRAALLARISRSPSAWLCTLLVGNNLANDAAVHAAVALLDRWPVGDPHLLATFLLTPLVFLFGEVLPKQRVLARPLERSLALAPILAGFRLLLWPVATPLAGLLRLLRLGGSAPLGRHELGALLLAGLRPGPAAARAAHRALEAHGRGLEPFLRTDLPLVRDSAGLEEARAALAATPDGLGLLAADDGGLRLIRSERLALAARARRPAELAEDLPVLDPELDLSAALQELRRRQAAVALVGEPGKWRGVVDLEHILVQLLTAEAPAGSDR
ncbi:MAG: DUF21 domain-containing protein [Planctomycetota bacterium]|nr:MAG: DUF21 domain-containing protein [Planctomycetota bacterium]